MSIKPYVVVFREGGEYYQSYMTPEMYLDFLQNPIGTKLCALELAHKGNDYVLFDFVIFKNAASRGEALITCIQLALRHTVIEPQFIKRPQ